MKSLTQKLGAFVALGLLVVFAVLGFVHHRQVSEDQRARLIQSFQGLVSMVDGQSEWGLGRLEWDRAAFERILGREVLAAVLCETDGQVILSFEPAEVGADWDAVLPSNLTMGTLPGGGRGWYSEAGERARYATQVQAGPGETAVLLLEVDVSDIQAEERWQLTVLVVACLGFVLLIVALIVFYMGRHVTRRLHALNDSVDEIISDRRVIQEPLHCDEISRLEQAIEGAKLRVEEWRNEVEQAEQALRSSQEQLDATFRSIADAVISTDTRSRVTGLNSVAEELTGWREEEAKGRLLSKVFRTYSEDTGHAVDGPASQVLRTGITSGISDRIVLVHRDGPLRPIASSAAPIRNRQREISGVVLVFRDMTKEREQEKRLRQAHDLLEERVEERTHELIEVNKRLAREIDERTRLQNKLLETERLAAVGVLAGGVAHEFNNINAVVMGFAQLALERGEVESGIKDALEYILKAGQRAKGITHNLMTFSRLKLGALALGELRPCVEQAVEIHQDRLEEAKIEVVLELGETPGIQINAEDMVQVFSHMIDNAVHAMIDREERVLRLSTGVENGRVFARIEDSGWGIEEGDLGQVFLPFFSRKGEHATGHTPLSRVKGTGLGLSVVHAIIDGHGGEVEVESRVDIGTTFSVFLSMASEGATVVSTSGRRSSGDSSILVMEDDHVVERLLRRVLMNRGVKVSFCATREALLEQAEQADFDLLLLDLPKKIAHEMGFLRSIHRQGEGPSVVVISNQEISSSMSELRSVGVLEVLQKPFGLEEIRSAVDRGLCLGERT